LSGLPLEVQLLDLEKFSFDGKFQRQPKNK
jgi:hypothetical protein